MTDIFTKEKRSEIMSKIRSKGTKIELRMKNALEEAGIEFTYQPKMFGRPDFFISPQIAIFCDSSFWHGRNWRNLKKQLSKEYWYKHIRENIERDKVVNAELKRRGYIVMRFWDDDIEKHLLKCVEKIKREISKYQMKGCLSMS
jgi:DNA mismatch endonuclease (patch repair protein)